MKIQQRLSMRSALVGLTALVALAASPSGCVSTTTFHSARPVAEGHTELMLGAGPLHVTEDGGRSLTLPMLEFQLRHGVSEAVDFGAKAYTLGLSVDLNIGLMQTPTFALSLDPTLDLMYVSLQGQSVKRAIAWLPLLMDIVHTRNFTLTLGPKVGVSFASLSSGDHEPSKNLLWAGGLVGARVRVNERFALLPELSVQRPLSGEGTIVGGGLGFAF